MYILTPYLYFKNKPHNIIYSNILKIYTYFVALKVHAEKNTENHGIGHHLTPNCSTNSEEKNIGNPWVGTAFDVKASQLDKSKTLSETESISDINNVPSSQGNIRLSDEHSSQCSLGKETIFSDTKVSNTLNQVDLQYEDDINTKHLSYDIFYKPRESGVGSNANHLQSLNCVPESFSDEFGLGDYSQDEILCVSVEENKPEVSFDESQEVEVYSIYNSVQSNDFVSKENQSNSEVGEYDSSTYSATIEGTLLDIQNSEEMPSSNTIADSDKCLYVNQSNITQICRPNQLSLSTVPLNESLIDEAMHVSEHVLCLPSPLNFYSQTIEDVPTNATEFVSQNINMQCDDLRSLENCSNQIAYGNDNLVVCNSAAVHNYGEQEGNENVIGVCAPEVPRNALDLQNGFSVQDDDSGVSSTEDISGNSPPQMNSGPENSVVNENCDIGMHFSNVEPCSEDSRLPDITNHIDNFENSTMCGLSTIEETKQGTQRLNHEESTSMKDSDVNLITPIENNTGSKSNYFNQNSSGYVYNTEASLCSNEVLAFCGGPTIETTSNSNIPATTINESTSKFPSQSAETLYDSENPIEHTSTSQIATNFSDIQNSNASGERETVAVKDPDQNLMDSETVECTEDLNLMDTNDCISPRLQRPTTLNLPSLVIASPGCADETLEPSQSSDDNAISADNLSAATVAEPIISGIFITYT